MCDALLYSALPCPALPSPAQPCPALPCPALPCPINRPLVNFAVSDYMCLAAHAVDRYRRFMFYTYT